MTLRMGELFAGYTGLGMGAAAALGGDVETAWVSEIDAGACKVLAHRLPGVPNLGDITAINWSAVEPVDLLTGGFPCQDVSTAGKRAGMKPGTRSGLWSHFAYAIDRLRPRLVVIENVRGLLSAEAHSDVEPCPWCMGDDAGGALRALGAVLGDLADLGYDAVWCGLRAADVGACHGRFRVFIAAYPSDAAHAPNLGHERGRSTRAGRPGPTHGSLLPTPRATRGGAVTETYALLSAPTANEPGGTAEQYRARWAKSDGRRSTFLPLSLEVQRLLPTPKTQMHTRTSDAAREKYSSGDSMGDVVAANRFGDYAAAIARHEQAFGHPAPDPTEPAPRGGRRLSCRFDEFMMGLPPGWITDVPGVTHNETLRMCGNGVVPQQATEAIRWCLAQIQALDGWSLIVPDARAPRR